MSDTHVVLYVSSIDEATDMYDLPLTSAESGGEDWALIAHGDTRTRMEFIYSEQTVVLPTEKYETLRDDYPGSEEFHVTNATKAILDAGSDAILDARVGQPPLYEIEDALPRAVAEVFVMQAEQDMREWPPAPTE